MNAVVSERRSKPVIRRTADPLAECKQQIAQVTSDLESLRTEYKRCQGEAAQFRKIVDTVPEARANLAALHEAKAAGESITGPQIRAAEAALSRAIERGDRASIGEQGAQAALSRFEAAITEAEGELTALAQQVSEIQSRLLFTRAEGSREQYRTACGTFVAAYALHCAEIEATRIAAKQLGVEKIGADGRSIGVPPNASIQLLTSPRWVDPWETATDEERSERHGIWTFPVLDAVRSQVQAIAASMIDALDIE